MVTNWRETMEIIVRKVEDKKLACDCAHSLKSMVNQQ
jgi:hypothetical protein